jgi:hypothetical protein
MLKVPVIPRFEASSLVTLGIPLSDVLFPWDTRSGRASWLHRKFDLKLLANKSMRVKFCLSSDAWALPQESGCITPADGLGCGNGNLGVGLYQFFHVLGSAGATNIMRVTFLIPVSAILLGAAFLGEPLEIKHVGGMGLIGVGLAAIDGRLPSSFRIRGRYGGSARTPNP